jgi:hypothetical protein
MLFRADADAVNVRVVPYYPDVFAGTYGSDAAVWQLSATQDGIALSDGAGTVIEAARCWRSELGISEDLPEQDYTLFSYDAVAAAGLPGIWTGTYWDDEWQVHSLTLELTTAGEVRMRDVCSEAIPRVYKGYCYIAGADDMAPAGSVVFRLARCGGYKMPLYGWCTMTVGIDGTLSVAEDPGSWDHLTKLGEYQDAAVLRPIPAVRRVVEPKVQTLAESARANADPDADGTPEEIRYTFVRNREYAGEIEGINITVDGEPFEFENLFAYDADVYLITNGMSGAAWLYVDCLTDNDYHYTAVYGIQPGFVWYAGEFYGGFTAAPTDPENMELSLRFHLVSTLVGARSYRVGLDGYPEPVDSFYRIDSDHALTAKTDIDGWEVDDDGVPVGAMTIPAGTKAKPIRTDGAETTDLLLSDGRCCRVWSSGPMGTVSGIDIYDAFEGVVFAG